MNVLKRKIKQRENIILAGRAETYFSFYFKNMGFAILHKNYSVSGTGELDLVANRGKTLYFIEVKARTVKDLRDLEDDMALWAISAKKKQKLFKTLNNYVAEFAFNQYNIECFAATYYENCSHELIKSDFVPIF